MFGKYLHSSFCYGIVEKDWSQSLRSGFIASFIASYQGKVCGEHAENGSTSSKIVTSNTGLCSTQVFWSYCPGKRERDT